MTMNRILRALLMVTLSMALAVGMWGVIPARKAVAATKTWDGGASTMNWSDAANWNDDIVPTSADDVVLDNTYVSGSYTVNLPTIAISTTINKLTITPGSGNIITLVLPSGNTANPGLNVGDNTSGTDDIILNDGAVLKNSSGATAGTGVAVNSTTNGTFRINNGGRYIHNTTRGNSGIVSRLSSVAGTEIGIFEYDVPTTSSYSISVAGRTYGTLMLSRSGATSFSYTASGGTPLIVQGNLIINANAAWNTTGFTGGIRVAGNWTNDGSFTVATNAVTFNGTLEQTIGGSTTTDFYTLTVNSGATVVIPATNIPTVAGTLTNNGTLKQTQTVNGTTVNFLTISADKYRGVDIATTNDLGSVTVAIQGNTDACTTNPASPAYVKRCFSITPTNNLAARLTLWATDAEMNGIDYIFGDAALFRYVTNQWVEQTWVEQGTDTNNYNYITADVTGFSSFLMGESGETPTAVALSGLSATSPFAALAVGLLAAAGLVVLRKRK